MLCCSGPCQEKEVEAVAKKKKKKGIYRRSMFLVEMKAGQGFQVGPMGTRFCNLSSVGGKNT